MSDDEKKRPIIEPNTDMSNIRRALDKIQYGILEGARQIQHLDPETVSDFYTAVERHSGSPADLEQLIRINDALPSLLYAVSQKILVPHEFRTKLLEIARLLIKRGWFCPKRLKTVFYRLLEIEPNKSRFADLFDAMEPEHRVYFLLTVYGCWCSRREHEDLLEVLLAKARQDVDPFVWGFAIAMSAKMGTDRVAGESIASATDLFPPRAGWFALSRLLGSHDYGSLSADQRDVIRRSLTEKSPDFVKALMLENLRSLPATYLDGTYLRGLLSEFRFMLVPPTSRLLAMASDRSEVFDAIVDFVICKPSFKSICVSLVTQALREKRASAGRTDIMNLQSLYVHVHDAELRKAMLDVLASIDAVTLDTDGDFAKTHKQVANYNGCYLFQRIWDTGDYQYLELIPEDRLRESCRGNFDSTKRILADLSSKGVLPPHEFSYDSGKREVTLRLDPRQDTVELSRGGLTLDPATIAEALCLAADAFKKATYFHRMTGKVPLVTLQNLLFGRRDGNVVFRTVGRSLKTPLVVSGVTIGEEDTDIARMVGLLLQEFFFVSAVDAMEFLKKGHHPASSAFLAQMIGGMSSKEPKHRYSSLRFQYLATAFAHSQARSDKEVAVLYLLERLKAELFRNNSERISWDGVCSALNGHIADVRVLLDKRRLSAAPLQNRTVGYTATNGMHLLSLQMLNLSMNRHRIPILRSADPAYLDLVEYLLLYAALCVEVVSLCRAAWGRGLVDVEKYHSLLAGSEVVIEACRYTQTFPSSDLAALFTYRRDGTGTGIRDLSLRQVALLALLACGEERVEADHLYIDRSHGFPAESFDDLAHACLSRIPRAEAGVHSHVKAVLSALRTGDDLASTADLSSLREALDVVAHDFTRLRRRMKIKRYRGWADGKKFPEKIVCRRKFRRPVTAELDAIPSMALVNVIPSSQYQCSWDMCEGVVTNLVVPSSGAYSLLKDLRKGKFFGRKLSYLYSGRAMLLWDVALFAASLLLMVLLKCGEVGSQNTLLKSFCAAGFEISTGIALFLGPKVLYDLRHWFPQIDAAIVHLRRVSAKDRIREDDNESSRCDV